MAALHGLRTVIYQVADLTSSKAWWRDFLDQEPYFDQPFYVGFNVRGYELGLLPAETSSLEGALTYWGVDDVAESVIEAQSKGAQIHTEPTSVGDGIVTATVKLPDDSIVGFIHNPHFTLE